MTGEKGSEQFQHLPNGVRGVHPGGLQLGTDACFDGSCFPVVGHAQNSHRARIRLAQTEDDLDGSGLSGAVGAEHAEDLAWSYRKGEAIDCLDLCVALAQASDFNSCG